VAEGRAHLPLFPQKGVKPVNGNTLSMAILRGLRDQAELMPGWCPMSATLTVIWMEHGLLP
jgi:hypothetical protein